MDHNVELREFRNSAKDLFTAELATHLQSSRSRPSSDSGWITVTPSHDDSPKEQLSANDLNNDIVKSTRYFSNGLQRAAKVSSPIHGTRSQRKNSPSNAVTPHSIKPNHARRQIVNHPAPTLLSDDDSLERLLSTGSQGLSEGSILTDCSKRTHTTQISVPRFAARGPFQRASPEPERLISDSPVWFERSASDKDRKLTEMSSFSYRTTTDVNEADTLLPPPHDAVHTSRNAYLRNHVRSASCRASALLGAEPTYARINQEISPSLRRVSRKLDEEEINDEKKYTRRVLWCCTAVPLIIPVILYDLKYADDWVQWISQGKAVRFSRRHVTLLQMTMVIWGVLIAAIVVVAYFVARH
ncbi:MAG: hypothetical protein Q9159_006628 [Coniocarpon cinnabarinum]